MLARHAPKTVAAQQIVHHPNPNVIRQWLLAFPSGCVERTTAQVLLNRVAEKEPSDGSDCAEYRDKTENEKRPLHMARSKQANSMFWHQAVLAKTEAKDKVISKGNLVL
jgi:hypothetical protein